MLALFQLDAINLLLGRTLGKQIKDYSELTEIENSAVIEIGNILISSFINALSRPVGCPHYTFCAAIVN